MAPVLPVQRVEMSTRDMDVIADLINRQYVEHRAGTTITGYVRRVRLEQAHRQLQAADPTTGTTVAEIARRWGWASPANFATAYRKQYGLPPSHTLRT